MRLVNGEGEAMLFLELGRRVDIHFIGTLKFESLRFQAMFDTDVAS